MQTVIDVPEDVLTIYHWSHRWDCHARRSNRIVWIAGLAVAIVLVWGACGIAIGHTHDTVPVTLVFNGKYILAPCWDDSRLCTRSINTVSYILPNDFDNSYACSELYDKWLTDGKIPGDRFPGYANLVTRQCQANSPTPIIIILYIATGISCCLFMRVVVIVPKGCGGFTTEKYLQDHRAEFKEFANVARDDFFTSVYHDDTLESTIDAARNADYIVKRQYHGSTSPMDMFKRTTGLKMVRYVYKNPNTKLTHAQWVLSPAYYKEATVDSLKQTYTFKKWISELGLGTYSDSQINKIRGSKIDTSTKLTLPEFRNIWMYKRNDLTRKFDVYEQRNEDNDGYDVTLRVNIKTYKPDKKKVSSFLTIVNDDDEKVTRVKPTRTTTDKSTRTTTDKPTRAKSTRVTTDKSTDKSTDKPTRVKPTNKRSIVFHSDARKSIGEWQSLMYGTNKHILKFGNKKDRQRFADDTGITLLQFVIVVNRATETSDHDAIVSIDEVGDDRIRFTYT